MSNAPLSHRLERLLIEQLDQGVWSPGDRLPTLHQIAATFGCSAGVVREAIARLIAAGRIEIRHGLGTFVRAQGISFALPQDQRAEADIADMMELRLAVEVEMAGLAAERRSAADIAHLRHWLAMIDAAATARDGLAAAAADRSLHAAIAVASANPYFERFLALLGELAVPPMAAQEGDAWSREAKALAAEHLAIVEAIARGDREAARSATRRHLRRGARARPAALFTGTLQ